MNKAYSITHSPTHPPTFTHPPTSTLALGPTLTSTPTPTFTLNIHTQLTECWEGGSYGVLGGPDPTESWDARSHRVLGGQVSQSPGMPDLTVYWEAGLLD